MRADDVTQLFNHSSVSRKATAEEISAVEAEIGALPPCYKTFAETFGYGTTNGLLVIEMPFNMFGHGGLVVRGNELHEQVHWLVDQLREDGAEVGDLDCLEPYGEESQAVASFFDDLRFYGNGINGEYLCWRRHKDGVFKFYVIDRAGLSIRFAGTSLIEFIRRTQTDDVKTLLGSGYDALPSTFVGATAKG